VRTWKSLTRDETHVRHAARVYIYQARAHSSLAQNCRTDGRVSSTRAVVDQLCRDTLVLEPTVASSQQSVERGATLGRCGRVVATRWPVVGGAWCVPESSRTSGLSAGSGDLRDRRSMRTRVSYCFGASDRLERVCRAATCVKIVGWR